MAHDDKNPDFAPPSSLLPDTTGIDLDWDDDVASSRPKSTAPKRPPPRDEFQDFADRVTAVPELPMRELTAQLMAEADRSTDPFLDEPSPESPTLGRQAPRPRWSTQPTLPPPLVPDQRSPEGFAPSEPSPLPGRPMLLETLLEPPGEPTDATPAPGRGTPKPQQPVTKGSAKRPPLRPQGERGFPHEALTLDLDEFGHNDAGGASAAQGYLGQSSAARPTLTKAGPLGPPTPASQELARQQLRERYALGDFSGALEIADQILAAQEEDEEAQRFADSCRDVLVQMLSTKLAPLDRVVRTAVAPDQIRWLSLNHRAGFLLSLVDGVSTAEELLDISGMPRLEALRILSGLLDQRVVVLELSSSRE